MCVCVCACGCVYVCMHVCSISNCESHCQYSLAKELNLNTFTARTEVVTMVINSTMKNVVEKLLNVSMSCTYIHYI